MKNLFDQCHQNNILEAESNVDDSSINFHKSKEFFEKNCTSTSNSGSRVFKINKPKYFALFSLPLELQDMIVAEIVHNCPPDNWLRFAQTSKYSNWLVKRAKPKKIIDGLYITFKGQRFGVKRNEKIGFMSESEVLKLLQTCQIKMWYSRDNFFGVENKYWTPEFEKACFDSTRFLNDLSIKFTRKSEVKCLKFYENLQCLKALHVFDYVSNVSLLPKLPHALSFARHLPPIAQDDSPDVLINLAQKTRDFPLSYFRSKIKFDPSEVQQFLQNGVFHDRCSFVFHVELKKLRNYEKMLMSFGAKKLSSSKFVIPAPNSDQNVREFSILLTI